ncbi:hypothetical protein NKG94_08190 [Micromonospora sp. M12]
MTLAVLVGTGVVGWTGGFLHRNGENSTRTAELLRRAPARCASSWPIRRPSRPSTRRSPRPRPYGTA